MSIRFSIMKTIDFDKLDGAIEHYKNQNNYEPYIFINKDTANAIGTEFEKELGFDVDFDVDIDDDIKLKSYCGYKIFINNDLKFGIVEIR